jgi:hypothetical protein
LQYTRVEVNRAYADNIIEKYSNSISMFLDVKSKIINKELLSG